jgi:hypothetical protein
MTAGRSAGRLKWERLNRSEYPAESGADSYHQVAPTVAPISARSLGVGARAAETWPQAARGETDRRMAHTPKGDPTTRYWEGPVKRWFMNR